MISADHLTLVILNSFKTMVFIDTMLCWTLPLYLCAVYAIRSFLHPSNYTVYHLPTCPTLINSLTFKLFLKGAMTVQQFACLSIVFVGSVCSFCRRRGRGHFSWDQDVGNWGKPSCKRGTSWNWGQPNCNCGNWGQPSHTLQNYIFRLPYLFK